MSGFAVNVLVVVVASMACVVFASMAAWASGPVNLAGVVGVVVAGFVALVALAVGGVAWVGSSYDARACASVARESGMETRFARFAYLNWDCLVRTPAGWLPYEQVRLMVEGGASISADEPQATEPPPASPSP